MRRAEPAASPKGRKLSRLEREQSARLVRVREAETIRGMYGGLRDVPLVTTHARHTSEWDGRCCKRDEGLPTTDASPARVRHSSPATSAACFSAMDARSSLTAERVSPVRAPTGAARRGRSPARRAQSAAGRTSPARSETRTPPTLRASRSPALSRERTPGRGAVRSSKAVQTPPRPASGARALRGASPDAGASRACAAGAAPATKCRCWPAFSIG